MPCSSLEGVLAAHQGRVTCNLHQALFADSLSDELVCWPKELMMQHDVYKKRPTRGDAQRKQATQGLSSSMWDL